MRMFSAPLPCLHPACAALLCTASSDTMERSSTHPCHSEALWDAHPVSSTKELQSWKKGRPRFSSAVSPALILGHVRNFTEQLVLSCETKGLLPIHLLYFFNSVFSLIDYDLSKWEKRGPAVCLVGRARIRSYQEPPCSQAANFSGRTRELLLTRCTELPLLFPWQVWAQYLFIKRLTYIKVKSSGN